MSEKEGRSDVMPERTMDQCGAEKEAPPPVAERIRKTVEFIIAEARLHDCDEGLIEEQVGGLLELLGHPGTLSVDMLALVVSFLKSARSAGWEIQMMHQGRADGTGRYELTVWRDADAPEEASPRQMEDASPGRTQSDPNQIRKAGRG